MTSSLSTTQSVKQGARQFMSVASDKMKLASATVTRGDTRELDVAIIKSTSPQYHVVPKEKHVRTLKDIVHNGMKDHVREVIRELLQRLKSATDWLTALKSLMVFHRLMRECDAIFLNALVQFSSNTSSASTKGRSLLNMGNFLDTTNIDGRFDFSEWIRGYGKYLDEQLEVYRELNFYPEMEHGGESRMRTLSGDQLLKQLPVLQRLQQRLMDCKPSGVAAHDPVVQAALMAVLKESFKVYKAISEGIINLADRFFEMEYLDAQKGLEVYKESLVDNTRLQEYYREVEEIEELKRAVQFPKLENLPPDFLTQMEGYVKEAPRPLEEAAAMAKKKSPPLRRGTRATQAGKSNVRFDTASSGQSASSPTDPGMIGAFSKVAEPNGGPALKDEPNLLGLEELTISEPSPANNGTLEAFANGFGDAASSSHPTPAGAVDPFSAPLQSPFSEAGVGGFVSGPPTPASNNVAAPNPSLASDPFAQQQMPAFSSVPAAAPHSGSNNPFATDSALTQPGNKPPAAAYQPGGSTAPPPQAQLFPSGLPQSQPASAAQRGGNPMVASSHQHSGYNSFNPQQQGFGAQQTASQGYPYSQAGPLPTNGNLGSSQGAHSGFGSQQLSEFGSAGPRPAEHATPAKSPGPAVAAGLIKPTNVTLAKEAALHDPFAGLTNLKPSTTPKYSPPLKNFSASPVSSVGQTSSTTSPGLQHGQAAQPNFGHQPAGNGLQGFGNEGNGLGPSAFGAPVHQQPSQSYQQATPQPSIPKPFESVEFEDRSDSLI